MRYSTRAIAIMTKIPCATANVPVFYTLSTLGLPLRLLTRQFIAIQIFDVAIRLLLLQESA